MTDVHAGPGRRDFAGAGTVRAALLGLAPLAVAATFTHLIARMDARSFDDVILFPPAPQSMARTLLALVVLAAGYAGVFITPGLLVMRALRLRLPNAPANALAAFVLSLASVAAAWAVAQAVTEGAAARTCLYVTVSVLDAASLVAGMVLAAGAPALPELPQAAHGTARSELLVPATAVLLLLVAAAATMPGKITLEALEGDATEVHGFAASLFTHALPSWDLENGAWGFYPTFMFFAYPVFGSLAVLGDSEAAVRLPALLFFGVLVLALLDLAGRGRTRTAGGAVRILLPMLVAAYLSLQVGAYYAGYHPYHGDLASPAIEEWMATALVACAMLLVRDAAPALAAVAAFLALITFPGASLLCVIVGLAGLLSSARRGRTVRWALNVAGLAAAYAILFVVVTRKDGTFAAAIHEWWAKYFAGRGHLGSETPRRMLAALGWWALLAGGLPVVGLVAAIRDRDATTRPLALVTVLWVAFFVLSPDKSIHYFLPVALLPMAVSLRAAAARAETSPASSSGGAAPGARDSTSSRGAAVGRAAPLLLSISAFGAIVLCHPRPSPPYTADRDFGRRTIFFAASEPEAVAFSKVLFHVMEPLWKWQRGGPWVIGHHTWAMYADRGYELTRAYDFYVGEGPPPAKGLTEITRLDGPDGRPVVFWARGGRAALREWMDRTYPLRTEQSRFNFEMPAK